MTKRSTTVSESASTTTPVAESASAAETTTTSTPEAKPASAAKRTPAARRTSVAKSASAAKTTTTSTRVARPASVAKPASTDAVVVPQTVSLEIVPALVIDPDVPALYEVSHAITQGFAKDGYAVTTQELPAGSLVLRYSVEVTAKKRGRRSAASSSTSKTAKKETPTASAAATSDDERLALLKLLAPVVTSLYDAVDKKQGIKVALEVEGTALEVSANDLSSSEHIGKLAKRWTSLLPKLTVTSEGQFRLLVSVPKRISLAS